MSRQMKILGAVVMVLLFTGMTGNVHAVNPTVVNFDGLHPSSEGLTLSGTNYAGLTWEWGNSGAGGYTGESGGYPWMDMQVILTQHRVTLLMDTELP